jgi:isopentenyl phosphate kinase
MKLLKLGGSVITRKEEQFTVNICNIQRLAKEIANTLPQKIAIIHGGGSYGHPLAKQYEINKGYYYPEQLLGFSKTHQAMVELNKIIINNLLNAKVPAFGISPSSFITTENARITKLDIKIIENLLDSGMIPVLYGDAVLDTKQRFAILSGDQLIVEMALKLKAEKIIFGSDVDGVFTANPKIIPDARLIENFSLKNLHDLIKKGESSNNDVTGGMIGKIIESKEAVKAGIEVMLVNASLPKRVQNALLGKKVKGTMLTL